MGLWPDTTSTRETGKSGWWWVDNRPYDGLTKRPPGSRRVIHILPQPGEPIMSHNDMLLEAIDISKEYGGADRRRSRSFWCRQAENRGSAWPANGAGKTTSFRITIGMINPDGGQVLFHGKDISNLPMYKRAQLGMGYLSQEPSIFTPVNGRAEPAGHPGDDTATSAGAEAPLHGVAGAIRPDQDRRSRRPGPSRAASGASSRSPAPLVTSPTIILLDEPFSGGRPDHG